MREEILLLLVLCKVLCEEMGGFSAGFFINEELEVRCPWSDGN